MKNQIHDIVNSLKNYGIPTNALSKILHIPRSEVYTLIDQKKNPDNRYEFLEILCMETALIGFKTLKFHIRYWNREIANTTLYNILTADTLNLNKYMEVMKILRPKLFQAQYKDFHRKRSNLSPAGHLTIDLEAFPKR